MVLIKEPILISPDLWNSKNVGSGCSVIEIKFSYPRKVTRIMFRNYYSASICGLVNCMKRCKDEMQMYDKKDFMWNFGIPKMILMPYPHYEDGGRSYFSLLQPCDDYLLGIRLVLKQPSSQWKKFFIHQISILNEKFPSPEILQPLHTDQVFMATEKRIALVKLITKQTHNSLQNKDNNKIEDKRKAGSGLISDQREISPMEYKGNYEFDLFPMTNH